MPMSSFGCLWRLLCVIGMLGIPWVCVTTLIAYENHGYFCLVLLVIACVGRMNVCYPICIAIGNKTSGTTICKTLYTPILLALCIGLVPIAVNAFNLLYGSCVALMAIDQQDWRDTSAMEV